MRKEDKGNIIAQLGEVLNEYAHFYLVDVTGLNAATTSAMRRKCFQSEIKMVVVKNTLLHKALEAPAARIMRTTAQCMIVFHKEFAHTALCLFHRAAAVSAHHILIHMCCGERRGTRLNRGDIVLPQKFRNRSPICPWRDRNLAQVRQLPYIFPARVIRLTAPVAGKRKALQYPLMARKDEVPIYFRTHLRRFLALTEPPHISCNNMSPFHRRDLPCESKAAAACISSACVLRQQTILFKKIQGISDLIRATAHARELCPFRLQQKVAHKILHAAKIHIIPAQP